MAYDLKNLVAQSPFRDKSIIATAQANVRNPLCGDLITLKLTINDSIITDVSFSSEGCLLSQAAISILAQEIFNVSLEHAATLNVDMLQKLLHVSLGPTRRECIILAHTSLQHILKQYTASPC